MEELDNPQRELEHRVREHLAFIYPSLEDDSYLSQLIAEMSLGRNLQIPEPHQNNWDETDNILITYGNSIMNNDE